MNNSLVPTSITDKNGKQTTVHKRPAGDAKTGRVAAVSKPVTAQTAPVVEFAPSDFNPVAQKVIYASEKIWDVRNEVMDSRAAGEKHRYDHHYDAMWAGRNINILGGRDGWTEQDVLHNLAGVRQIREQVKNNELTAADLISTVEKETKEKAIEWCDYLEGRLIEAIETEGRSLAVNAAGAIERYRDFEGGRNLS